jgi:hypothetical protein
MPYNPSSAYPRHSTYTPPVYGREYAKGFNEVDWNIRPVGSVSAPRADVSGAIERATTRPSQEGTRLSFAAMGQKGIIAHGQHAAGQWAAQKRAEYLKTARKRAAKGEMTGAEPEAAETWDPQDFYQANKSILEWRNPGAAMGPAPASSYGPAGGREHAGGVNDRLAAMSQREESSAMVENVVENVLTGNIGGRMKIPTWRGGFSRRRGGT